MKVNELRIGNYVNIQNFNQVIRLYTFFEISECIINEEDILPILLDEEWLIKLGFEKYKDAFVKYNYPEDDAQQNIIEIICHKDLFSRKHLSFSFSCSGNYNKTSIDIEIKYVHQLQNIYFSINNEELTIND